MSDGLCPTCRKKVSTAEGIPFNNATYHPDCFLCKGCGQPIRDGTYSVKGREPYHLDCFNVRTGLLCAGCGYRIVGDYTVALNKAWHIDHLVCANCSRSLTSREVVGREGTPYCRSCYEILFEPRCSICHQPVLGEPVRNAWGDTYCRSHEAEYRKCSCCQRPICPSITRDGYIYGDGRVVCTICRESCIDDDNEAWHAYNEARRYLRSRGLDMLRTPIPLQLADRKQIAALAHTQSDGDVFGATLKFIGRQANGQRMGSVKKISILYGLPVELFISVAAHQLGHAWLCLNSLLVEQPETEEGFCELLGYLWLESRSTRTSDIWRQMMLENENPVFANGLRLALESYRRFSLPRILDQLRRTARLP